MLAKEAKDPSRCPYVTLKVSSSISHPILSHGATKANISITLTLLIFYVSVHPTDTTRLELIIPGEQHFYVRAVNAAERQRWLVALGSSKAGTLDSNKHKGKSAMSALFSQD